MLSAVPGLAHVALPLLRHMGEPPCRTLLADMRFHDDLLELEVYYLIP